MSYLVRYVTAKFTNKIPIVVGIGYIDVGGQFQPLGFIDIEMDVYTDKPGGILRAKKDTFCIPFTAKRSRIFTHFGFLLDEQWVSYPIAAVTKDFGHGTAFSPGQILQFYNVQTLLPEPSHGETSSTESLSDSTD